mmetsp:Transcript_15904/g.23952  ORF Transcript_15904/g.23952 Transcript_15904/m.23952 type:complete len:382 (-) Transcript_15904:92-1237(-)|eukprot:CAMPEP_0185029640 /NCGR_PEP_ID=MMETSP1103-20130426/16058_1 /TAXON_ID=36769 /ORGANISM="Paraphysomonas bandaiensis, Strain Caron Lab Isolate" /LENGTH=381 /DNA_ID=CAMNT_0027564457 /DNA_START=30 /DNA_END=1175 /DNA_ORIENTATION=-
MEFACLLRLCGLAALWSYCYSSPVSGSIIRAAQFNINNRPGMGNNGHISDTSKGVDSVPETLISSVEGNNDIRTKFEALCRNAQSSICSALEDLDGVGKFKTDAWVRPNGGGGISRVMSGGKVFEKAGVGVSVVYGTMPRSALRAASKRASVRGDSGNEVDGGETKFFACGISSVIHPRNPFCPTMHFNYRYFETEGGMWWFGGGTDITPCYLDETDLRHFHGTYKTICDKHDPDFYPRFKRWADEYFLIPHRGETRGLGGIFYDDMNDRDPEKLLALARDALDGVIPSYVPIVRKHMNDAFTPRQKDWQQIRRGRYVEFNLIYDRGTTFGLKTGGRVESILMSLPETARWEYNKVPEIEYGESSPEAQITRIFRNPVNWV